MSGLDAADLDAALYDPDPVVRDAARGRLAREVPPAEVPTLVALLDAPQRMTRRRVARILSEIDPERVAPALRAALRDADAAPRTRAGAARILGVLADGDEPALGDGLADPVVRVRRACAQPAAPLDALRAALGDAAPEVLARVAEALEARGDVPPRPRRCGPPSAAPAGRRAGPPAGPRAPADAALVAAARAGDPTALAHLADPVALAALLDDHPVEAAWAWPGWARRRPPITATPRPRRRRPRPAARPSRPGAPGARPRSRRRLAGPPRPDRRLRARRAGSEAGPPRPQRRRLGPPALRPAPGRSGARRRARAGRPGPVPHPLRREPGRGRPQRRGRRPARGGVDGPR
ncbi:MAG: HEAT repeat domain-containing protein [Myxococcales bacterium]|nr:HEAT repeat domain-containing protein [Myxococcales bacterium]